VSDSEKVFFQASCTASKTFFLFQQKGTEIV